MKTKLLTSTLLLSAAIQAQAGGLENTLLPVGLLFSEGENVLQAGLLSGTASNSGDYDASIGGGTSGSGTQDTVIPTLAYKRQINESTSAILALHQPLGADVSYSKGLYQGMNASWVSQGLAALVNYKIDDAFSVHGGAVLVNTETDVVLPGLYLYQDPAAPNYEVDLATDLGTGFVLGAAFQIPEIALLARITFESEIKHSFDVDESHLNLGAGTTTQSTSSATLPQAVTLQLESGVSMSTLAYVNVRWVDWSEFSLSTSHFTDLDAGPLVYFGKDTVSFEVGAGHMLNDQWSVGGYLAYEKAIGGETSPLAPEDGYKGLGLGATYAMSNLDITAGLGYFESDVDGLDAAGTQFNDMTSLITSVSADYRF